MTEAEWLTCTEPQVILDFLRGKASERKLRLFACACCRRIWPHLQRKGSRRMVEVCEEYADGRVRQRKLTSVWESADEAWQGIHWSGGGDVDQRPAEAVCYLGVEFKVNDAAESAAATFGALARGEVYERIWQTPGKEHDERWAEDDAVRLAAECSEESVQASLLRDILGNPFRPVTLAPSWLTSSVVALSQAAYEERQLPAGTLDPTRLAVLADALEDAGCTDAELLGHLRGPGPHVRGCWALDLILGKE
jgi:hypothetical protein